MCVDREDGRVCRDVIFTWRTVFEHESVLIESMSVC